MLSKLLTQIPSSCQVCGSWGKASLCQACINAHSSPQLRCLTCALPLPESVSSSTELRCGICLTHGSQLDAVHAAVDYAYPWDKLLARFKYGGVDNQDLNAQPALAKPLATAIRQASQNNPTLSAALLAAERSDLLIPIPLHESRQQERGFNHAQHLAQALFPKHSRLETSLLLRIKATATQASLPRTERLSNLKNAFAVNPLRANEITDRRVLLIDDVCTTTATLSAAAAVLRRAGAARVEAVVLARARLK